MIVAGTMVARGGELSRGKRRRRKRRSRRRRRTRRMRRRRRADDRLVGAGEFMQSDISLHQPYCEWFQTCNFVTV